MKQLRSLTLLFMILSFCPTVALSEKCTKDLAIKKAWAMNRVSQQMFRGERGAMSVADAFKFTTETSSAGKKIEQGKYSEACEDFNKLAKEYNIDIEEASKDILPAKELQTASGKGKCSMPEAKKRMMALFNQLEDLKANGDDVDDLFKLYMEMIDARADLMYTSPSQMCDIIQSFREAYNLK